MSVNIDIKIPSWGVLVWVIPLDRYELRLREGDIEEARNWFGKQMGKDRGGRVFRGW